MALDIWISSFIPGSIPGYSRPVPGAPGRTMIPGPLPISDCYHTDHRNFSTDPTASARMRSAVEISVSDFSLLGQSHRCNNTVECDCEDGDVECDKTPSATNLRVLGFQNSAAGCSFRFEGGAGNPCSTGAPEINWLVKVEAKRVGNNISIAVLPGSLVEPFPAFEMYARLNGPAKALFKRAPNPGATPWNLFGNPNQAVSGTAIL